MKRQSLIPSLRLIVGGAILTAVLAGCNTAPPTACGNPCPPSQPVPAPVCMLLPAKICIHPFTGTRTFGENGGLKGFDTRIEAIDAFGDATKAFGEFRFELYTYKYDAPDPKGVRLAIWTECILDAERNRQYWNGITRTYQFKLGWDEPIPIGQKMVLVVVFQSPFSERLIDQRVFVTGQ